MNTHLKILSLSLVMSALVPTAFAPMSFFSSKPNTNVNLEPKEQESCINYVRKNYRNKDTQQPNEDWQRYDKNEATKLCNWVRLTDAHKNEITNKTKTRDAVIDELIDAAVKSEANNFKPPLLIKKVTPSSSYLTQ